MTVKEVFELRKQGKIEEAYEAIRPMYAAHKGRYTTLCMFWVASDVFKKRMDEGRIEEASKILEALKRMQPRVDAINKELDTQATTTPTDTKLPWEKTDPQHSAASAFIDFASHRLECAQRFGRCEAPSGAPDLSRGCKPTDPAPTPHSEPHRGDTPAKKELSPFTSPVLPKAMALSTDEINQISENLSPSQDKLQRLLDILQGSMSVREMMAAMGFHSRDKFLKNYLSPALKAGLVEMTDPDSPKSPKQRYRRKE